MIARTGDFNLVIVGGKIPPDAVAFINVAGTYPVMATEFGDADINSVPPSPGFGCNANAYSDRLGIFATAGMSWTGWAWFVNPSQCGFPTLITSYDGTPSTPGSVVLPALGGTQPTF